MKFIGWTLATLVTITGAQAAERVVVLELFTSQGCSSCPPADVVLNTLADEDGIIALSRPVDYWDKLGWKDTLASPENTGKQRGYARTITSSNRVYTPQIVADGVLEGIGSNESTVRRMIATARARPQTANIVANIADGGTWRIAVSGADGADVHLIGYIPNARVVIEAGENAGREIDYSNAVKSDEIIGTAGGAPLTTPVLAMESGLQYVVVVQEGAAGPIAGGVKLGGS